MNQTAPETSHASPEGYGIWIAALAAVLFSAKAILAKLIYQHGADAITVISLRLAFAGPVFALIAVWETRKAKQVALSGREIALVWLLGLLGYYLSSLLDFTGLQYIPAALERLILFLTPTVVALISWVFLSKPIDARQWLGLLISYGGVVCVFWKQLRLSTMSSSNLTQSSLMIGCAFCFAATLSYAVYMVLSGNLVKKVGSLRLVAYAMTVSSLLTALHFALFARQDLTQFATPVYLYSILNAVFCTIVPVYLTMIAIAKIGPARTSQLSMLGPISLIFLGFWILHEPITLLQLIGTGIVLLGVASVTRAKAASNSA
jgi:drug/metabolite transporter (DMT)-like permease